MKSKDLKEESKSMKKGLMHDVITVSRHDLEDHKSKNGVATDLFCTGVIGHPRQVFLN